MNFAMNAEQQQLYDAVLAFAQSRLNDTFEERVAAHQFGHAEWALCGDFGLTGLSVPTDLGGMGCDSVTTCLAIEALGRGCQDQGLAFALSAHLLACVMPIVEHGSDDLQRRYVPKLASGQWIAANAITEGEAGSDAFALQSRAVRDGDAYVLSGSKSYVSNGPQADVFLVYASSNPDAGYLGIDAFVVERDTPGLTVGKPFEKMGLNTAPICSIYLEEARVPAANRLGSGGGGASIFTESMHWERTCLFGGYIGMMTRQLEQVVAYAQERRQFRKAIGKNQAISHKIAEMKMRLDAARLLLLRACWMRDQGKDAALEVAMAKLAVSEAAVASSLDAIQIYGGIGYMVESGVERALRDSVPSTLFSGTSEIQRNLIASRLGL